MRDSPWKAAASWWQSRGLAENPHSDQKTASKPLGRMKIIPSYRGGERKGRGKASQIWAATEPWEKLVSA